MTARKKRELSVRLEERKIRGRWRPVGITLDRPGFKGCRFMLRTDGGGDWVDYRVSEYRRVRPRAAGKGK